MKQHIYEVVLDGDIIEVGPDTPIRKDIWDELDELRERVRELEAHHPKMTPLDRESCCFMQLREFVKACKSGEFIDYDGCGVYATEDMVTDITVLPSEIMAGKIRDDYSYVAWYNK